MRVKLSEKSLLLLFSSITKKKLKLSEVAKAIGVNRRTLNDWKIKKTTIPISTFKNFIKFLGVKKEELNFKTIPEFWHVKEAGEKGAYARMRLYGNFGTTEGRRKGGIASIKTHKKLNTKFITLKDIKLPRYSKKLAEFMGILFGDGHLSSYQASVSTNSKTDMKHAIFVQNTINELFGFTPSVRKRKKENSVDIVASSKKMVSFLNKAGMPIGNKIKKSLRIPEWIVGNNIYKKYFLRGVFDTDGCIYVDTHKKKDKIYKHFGWTITSYAEGFISDIIKSLEDLGYSPTHRQSQKSVHLRRQNEIERYFSEIGTSNPKHIKRFKN